MRGEGLCLLMQARKVAGHLPSPVRADLADLGLRSLHSSLVCGTILENHKILYHFISPLCLLHPCSGPEMASPSDFQSSVNVIIAPQQNKQRLPYASLSHQSVASQRRRGGCLLSWEWGGLTIEDECVCQGQILPTSHFPGF